MSQARVADAILVVDNIVKRFETPDGVLTAVDRVSFGVAPGEFVGVIGPSGCGKSTLFNIIGGLLDGYEGTVKVSGERVAGPHPSIGMIFRRSRRSPGARCSTTSPSRSKSPAWRRPSATSGHGISCLSS